MDREAWEFAFGRLHTKRPCNPIALMEYVIASTSSEEIEVADAWLAVGQCVLEICSRVTVH